MGWNNFKMLFLGLKMTNWKGVDLKVPHAKGLLSVTNWTIMAMDSECCCSEYGTCSIREYNESTSLHGPKYITEKGRHWSERICWAMTFTMALTTGVYLTNRVLVKWATSPIITTIDTVHHPISEVDFPAVTICPIFHADIKKLIYYSCQNKYVFNSLNLSMVILIYRS